MNKASTIRTLQEKREARKHQEVTPASLPLQRIPGIDLPGFGSHYQALAVQIPMAPQIRAWTRLKVSHPDPCFWNRGGGRWLHTKRRGGQIGRQRERHLPLAPLSG